MRLQFDFTAPVRVAHIWRSSRTPLQWERDCYASLPRRKSSVSAWCENCEISVVQLLSARQPGDVYPRSTPHPLALEYFFFSSSFLLFTIYLPPCVALALMYFLYISMRLVGIFSSSCVSCLSLPSARPTVRAAQWPARQSFMGKPEVRREARHPPSIKIMTQVTPCVETQLAQTIRVVFCINFEFWLCQPSITIYDKTVIYVQVQCIKYVLYQ